MKSGAKIINQTSNRKPDRNECFFKCQNFEIWNFRLQITFWRKINWFLNYMLGKSRRFGGSFLIKFHYGSHGILQIWYKKTLVIFLAPFPTVIIEFIQRNSLSHHNKFKIQCFCKNLHQNQSGPTQQLIPKKVKNIWPTWKSTRFISFYHLYLIVCSRSSLLNSI